MMGSNKCIQFLTFIALTFVCEAKGAQTQVTSTEEAFLIRRIAEYWKDGDYAIVKSQIGEFFEKYPTSSMKEYFLGILGDLNLKEGKYTEALERYSEIQDPEVYLKIVLNKLQCYYELSDYEAITREGRPFLSVTAQEITSRKDELNFLMGEAFFRQAVAENDARVKEALAKQALPFYEALKGSSYDELRLFALAEMYHILGRSEEAIELYIHLANKNPGHAEELLFQAATLQASGDKTEAKANFEKIASMRGKRQYEATYNAMILAFEKEAYEEVLAIGNRLKENVPEQYRPTFNFMIGKSHYSLDHIQDAIDPLEAFIASESEASPTLKNALLIEMTCARIASDEPLFGRAFDRFAIYFPNDGELPKALFMHAMLLKEGGKLEKALDKLTVLESSYPHYEDRESLVFELANTTFELGNWSESRRLYGAYVTEFSGAERTASAWKFYLSSCINLHQAGDGYPKEQFYKDLSASLAQEGILTAEEAKECTLLQARIAYELSRYEESLALLSPTFLSTMDGEALAEAHFLTALNCQSLGNREAEVCLHVENALRLAPETYSTSSTHLQLFNSYISLSGLLSGQVDSENEYADKAAQHLYIAISYDPSSIKQENKLWLANHYYLKVKPERLDGEELKRAITLYTDLLTESGNLKSNLDLSLEGEVLKFAELLTAQGKNELKLTLVQGLIEQQSSSAEKEWKYQKQALFELARTYETLGQREKALETFAFINKSQENYPTSIASNATLESARLQYKMLAPEAKKADSPELLPILNHLKELQIRKAAESEPLHLEAALEYAKIRAEIATKEERNDRYLFFLKRLKDDFTSMDDVVVHEYHESLNHMPAKQEIFASYMKYVDAEMLRLKALQLASLQKKEEMEEVNEKALAIYGELKGMSNVPNDLASRIQSSIDEINAATSF